MTDTTTHTVRAMLAEIVIRSWLPMPDGIRFLGEGVGESGCSIMSMTFRRIADGQAWIHHLHPIQIFSDVQYDKVRDGYRWLDQPRIHWHGWSVLLHATEPLTDEPLSANLELELHAIARGDA